MGKSALVFYYAKKNRYSINALLSAIEDLELPEVFLFDTIELILDFLKENLGSKYNKVLLFFSLNSIQALELEGELKSIKTQFGDKVILVVGGPHATGLPAHLLDMGVDLVVKGEGEEQIRKIIKSRWERSDWCSIRGVAFKDTDGTIVETDPPPPVDIDSYLSFPVKRWRLFSPIEITRGCPFSCGYCQTPQIFRRRMRHRSPEVIIRMVKYFYESGKRDIRFITPNALSYGSSKKEDFKPLEELLRGVRDILGTKGRIFIGTFPSEIRPEFITEEAVEILKKYADNDNVVIGAQSGSNKVLGKIHRSHTVEDVIKAVEILQKAGFTVNVDMIFGLPFEDQHSLSETMQFLEILSKKGVRIHTHYFLPLPQTPLGLLDPKPVDRQIMEKLADLQGKGLAYGSWLNQMRISNRLSQLIRRYLN